MLENKHLKHYMIKMQLFVHFGQKDSDATNDVFSVKDRGATNDVILTTFG